MFATPYASIEAIGQAVPSAEENARETKRLLVEGKLLWGKDLLGIRHVRAPAGPLRLRDLDLELPGDPELAIAVRDAEGGLALVLPNGTSVPGGCRMTLRMGRAMLRLTLVDDDVAALPRKLPDPRAAFGILAAAVLHLVLLGFVAHGRAPTEVSAPSELASMQRMVADAEERALAELASVQPLAGAAAIAAGDGAAAATARSEGHRVPSSPSGASRDAAPATAGSADDPATFGMIALVAGDHAGAPGARRSRTARFAAELPALDARTASSAIGDIFAQTIDDAATIGGLGLSGAGEGGGGPGAGVPLGTTSTRL